MTFLVRRGVIELISEQEVDMRPITPPASTGGAPHAFWYELRDRKDKTLLAQPAQDPLPGDTEVFSDDPSQTVSRTRDSREEHAFSLVLPTLPDADSLVLLRARQPEAGPSALKAERAAEVATEVARFRLSPRAKGGSDG